MGTHRAYRRSPAFQEQEASDAGHNPADPGALAFFAGLSLAEYPGA
jgi:hypothetical protein